MFVEIENDENSESTITSSGSGVTTQETESYNQSIDSDLSFMLGLFNNYEVNDLEEPDRLEQVIANGNTNAQIFEDSDEVLQYFSDDSDNEIEPRALPAYISNTLHRLGIANRNTNAQIDDHNIVVNPETNLRQNLVVNQNHHVDRGIPSTIIVQPNQNPANRTCVHDERIQELHQYFLNFYPNQQEEERIQELAGLNPHVHHQHFGKNI